MVMDSTEYEEDPQVEGDPELDEITPLHATPAPPLIQSDLDRNEP